MRNLRNLRNSLDFMLQKELDLKNKQLAVKDKQIEELNARLAESSAAFGCSTADCTGGAGSSCWDDSAAACRGDRSGSAETRGRTKAELV